MLHLYRRHTASCKYANVDRPSEYTKCSCPIWAYGFIEGREVRRAVKLRDWARATKQVEEWERTGELKRVMTLGDSIVAYLADCKRRELQESTISSYAKSLGHLRDYFGKGKAAELITLEAMTTFVSERKYTPNKKGSTERGIKPKTAVKELETFRAFFNFCVDREWVKRNPARKLSRPKDNSFPTLPFEPKEVKAIIAACDCLEDGNPATREMTRLKARARILVMLYTGFRISDVVGLKRSAVDMRTGRVFVRAQKTGGNLYVKLGPDALAALKAIPSAGAYFFWNGESLLRSAIGTARLSISRVLKLAGVKGHPHRFRDTFSVELLKKGVDIRTVSMLLGHSSIKTTEAHYAPWVASFQKLLDDATDKLSFQTRTEKRTMVARRPKC